MNNLKAEFVRHQMPATAGTLSRRAQAVQGLDNLGHIDAAAGELNTAETQWCARIGDTLFPVLDFTVQKLDSGEVAVSFVAIADTLSIGESDTPAETPQGQAETAAEERERLVRERLTFAGAGGQGDDSGWTSEASDAHRGPVQR